MAPDRKRVARVQRQLSEGRDDMALRHGRRPFSFPGLSVQASATDIWQPISGLPREPFARNPPIPPPPAAHQKKYLSELARNSVEAGRIRTRHTDANSDQGPGISVSQMTFDWKRGPVIARPSRS